MKDSVLYSDKVFSELVRGGPSSRQECAPNTLPRTSSTMKSTINTTHITRRAFVTHGLYAPMAGSEAFSNSASSHMSFAHLKTPLHRLNRPSRTKKGASTAPCNTLRVAIQIEVPGTIAYTKNTRVAGKQTKVSKLFCTHKITPTPATSTRMNNITMPATGSSIWTFCSSSGHARAATNLPTETNSGKSHNASRPTMATGLSSVR
mmetsp:Transcript_74192/g.176738  ORF Transcript_74192/g.176738 Transcript_74192/m.176738 type:complete len:205 (-) Transcript_74192:182-796(-)